MTDEISAMLPLQPRDFLLLFALVDTELHGYGLLKAVEEETGGGVKMDPANLYRSLRRMKRDRLVAEAEGAASDPERRKTYRLTELGRRLVAAEAARVNRLARAVRAKRLALASEGRR